MATQERLRSRGAARSRRILAELALEIREARLAAGLSLDEAGRRAGLSGDKVWRLEHEKWPRASIAEACVLAAVLGLDFAVRSYPTGAPIRDVSQTPRLLRLTQAIAPPLRYRVEVPLPRRSEVAELRAWDLVAFGNGERTGFELESRITDMQAMSRRHARKRADDALDHFVLVVADTKHNRRVMGEFGSLLGDLPQLRTATVLSTLRAGKHPPSGWMFL